MNETQVKALFALALENYSSWGQYLVECHTEKEVLESGDTAKDIIHDLKARVCDGNSSDGFLAGTGKTSGLFRLHLSQAKQTA